MQSISFYQSHLDQVSRSFAFCIQKLSPKMRLWTSLSYLLCRTLDTVEDSQWNIPSLQEQQYSEFDSFMKRPPSSIEFERWKSNFPETLSSEEKNLIEDSYLLFNDLHELSPSIKSNIQNSVALMCAGMRFYSTRQKVNSSSYVSDLVDLNRYCFFVAGIVGELLSKLLLEYRKDFRPDPHFRKNAFHFGLFLQKINILKDQRVDEKEKRFLVPDRQLVLASLKENVLGSIEYLTALPTDEKGYRTFCGWSLFLGLASLPWIQKAFSNEDGTKIPRALTQELLSSVEAIAQDNDQLRSYLSEYMYLFPDFSHKHSPIIERDWFHHVSGNILPESDLLELRMI